MSRRGRPRKNIPNYSVGLFMECVDEDLTPWQQEANKKAHQDYQNAMKTIQAAKSSKNAQVVLQEKHSILPASGVGNWSSKSNSSVLKEIAPRSDSPDVIIVDEEPPSANRLVQAKRNQFTGRPLQAQNTPTGIALSNARKNQPTPEIVSGTFGYGIKRNACDKPGMPPLKVMRPANRPAPKSKQRKIEEQYNGPPEVEDSGTMVPLDEYYYGKKEGDPSYREDKGQYRFKCCYCSKMLYNNIRIMLHMQGHIDSEKQQNLDLSDLTQCKHCYKQFDTPFEMQSHVEKVHQSKSNILVCRICEKDHTTQLALQQHMKQLHHACEMPYMCQLCSFRSSVYCDVVDHFKKRHDSSQFAMCLYCLRVFRLPCSTAGGLGLTKRFYQHLQKHQSKSNSKKCQACKLVFFTKQDVKLHKMKDHLTNFKGILGGNAGTTVTHEKEQVMIMLPEKSKSDVKSLNAPTVSKVQDLSLVSFAGIADDYLCLECRQPMNNAGHFRKHIECSMCRFATNCNNDFSNHMMGFHAGNLAIKRKFVAKDRPMEKPMYCLCGHSSLCGNTIANHLSCCSKRTCYSKQPELKVFEYDADQEDFDPSDPYPEESETPDREESPEKDVPSLFGVLGLVKRANIPESDKTAVMSELTPEQIVSEIVDSTLDAVFPAQAAADEAVNQILNKFECELRSRASGSTTPEIPPELTGAQKWSTVKIDDSKAPSKSSIFLGSDGGPDDDTMLPVDEKQTTSPSIANKKDTSVGEQMDITQEDGENSQGSTQNMAVGNDSQKAGEETDNITADKTAANQKEEIETGEDNFMEENSPKDVVGREEENPPKDVVDTKEVEVGDQQEQMEIDDYSTNIGDKAEESGSEKPRLSDVPVSDPVEPSEPLDTEGTVEPTVSLDTEGAVEPTVSLDKEEGTAEPSEPLDTEDWADNTEDNRIEETNETDEAEIEKSESYEEETPGGDIENQNSNEASSTKEDVTSEEVHSNEDDHGSDHKTRPEGSETEENDMTVGDKIIQEEEGGLSMEGETSKEEVGSTEIKSAADEGKAEFESPSREASLESQPDSSVGPSIDSGDSKVEQIAEESEILPESSTVSSNVDACIDADKLTSGEKAVASPEESSVAVPDSSTDPGLDHSDEVSTSQTSTVEDKKDANRDSKHQDDSSSSIKKRDYRQKEDSSRRHESHRYDKYRDGDRRHSSEHHRSQGSDYRRGDRHGDWRNSDHGRSDYHRNDRHSGYDRDRSGYDRDRNRGHSDNRHDGDRGSQSHRNHHRDGRRQQWGGHRDRNYYY